MSLIYPDASEHGRLISSYMAVLQPLNGDAKYITTAGWHGAWARQTTGNTYFGETTWSGINDIIYCPLVVPEPVTIDGLVCWNGATVAGNVDIGIYDLDADGLPNNRLANAGSTAQAGADGAQEISISAIALYGFYYIALAASSTSATFVTLHTTTSSSGHALLGANGQREDGGGSIPLPNPAVFDAYASHNNGGSATSPDKMVPWIGARLV